MTDYQPVERALSSGADPAMLCQTCPWDRNCVNPPAMTAADIDAKMKEAEAQDEQRRKELTAKGENPGMPLGSLMTALTFGGRHTQALICPVFALRLRSSAGRKIAEGVKAQMQAWDDES